MMRRPSTLLMAMLVTMTTSQSSRDAASAISAAEVVGGSKVDQAGNRQDLQGAAGMDPSLRCARQRAGGQGGACVPSRCR